jgi:hypothetical protein
MQTKNLKKFLARIPKWPKDAQEDLVRSMSEIESRYAGVYHLNDEERSALKHSADDVRAGRFATEEEVDSVFDRYHRA